MGYDSNLRLARIIHKKGSFPIQVIVLYLVSDITFKQWTWEKLP